MGVNVNRDVKGWRVAWQLPDGRRGSLRLGRGSDKRHHVELAARMRDLFAARLAGVAPSTETAGWLARCDQRVHARLADLGLTPSRGRDRALVDFMDDFLQKHGHAEAVTAGTRKVWGRARAHVVAYFGADRRVSAITEDDARAFRGWLLQRPGRLGAGGLAEATVRKTCAVLSMVLKSAVKSGVITSNPFDAVPKVIGANPARETYVPLEAIRKVIDAATDPELRLLILLSRLAALRVPSEVRGLTWADVDWSERSLRVRSPKTERSGKAVRIVPLCPELYAAMEHAYHGAAEGEVHVLPRLRRHTAPTMPLLRLLRTAGIGEWPRPYHTLRASCITDWHHTVPLADTAAFSGHTTVVAAKHYLRATGAAFRTITRGALGVLESSETPQSGVQEVVLPRAAQVCGAVPQRVQPVAAWQDAAGSGSDLQAAAVTDEMREWTVLDHNTEPPFQHDSPKNTRGSTAPATPLGCIRGAGDDLDALIRAWPRLPSAIRQAVVVLVQEAVR
jgi:integrase